MIHGVEVKFAGNSFAGAAGALAKRSYWQQHMAALLGQGVEPIPCVETDCQVIDRVNVNAENAEFGCNPESSGQCVGEQSSSQSFPLHGIVHCQPTQQDHRDWVAREALRQNWRKMGDLDR